MPIHVLRRQQGWTDEWLQLNDDGTFTCTTQSPEIRRGGSPSKTEVLSEREVRGRFPEYKEEIDRALATWRAR